MFFQVHKPNRLGHEEGEMLSGLDLDGKWSTRMVPHMFFNPEEEEYAFSSMNLLRIPWGLKLSIMNERKNDPSWNSTLQH